MTSSVATEPVPVKTAAVPCIAYPNPARNGVYFSWTLPAMESARLEVYNVHGQRVYILPITGDSGQVFWPNQVPGIYFYHLVSSSAVVMSGKVIFN